MDYLKEMSNKKKMEYIWYYYKVHIIVASLIIAMIGYGIYSQVTKIEYVFNLTYMGNMTDQNKKDALEKQLTGMLVKDGDKKKQALVDIMPVINDSDNTMYVQKFLAEVEAGGIDIAILDKSQFEKFLKSGGFYRLDNIKGLDLSGLKYDKNQSNADNKKNEVYGIDVENNGLLKGLGFDVNNKVIGIISNSKKKDKAIQVLKWMLKK